MRLSPGQYSLMMTGLHMQGDRRAGVIAVTRRLLLSNPIVTSETGKLIKSGPVGKATTLSFPLF